MTNEELAAQAKAGDKNALAQLWEQNRGLLSKLFRELANKAGARMAAMGITWEDVEQSFFLAVALAVRLYEPERGVLFASFLSYPVKRVFFELVGWRTEQQRRDPLGQSISLDEPISRDDGSETTRGELFPDPAADRQFEDAEERMYTEQLHAVLEDCISALDESRAAVIRARYFEDMKLSDIGERFGITTSRVGELERDAMRKIRSGRNIQRLRQYRDMVISKHAYHGTGLSAWRYNGSSVEERVIVHLEDKGLL